MFQLQPRKRKFSVGSFFVILIASFKFTKLVSVLKVLKFTKPLVTVISMVISAVLYGMWLGPWFGVGLIAMLFIHEMGHVIALRLKGMETPGPVFIPFLGAAIFLPNMGDRDTEAFVGYGGPFLGTVGALLCFAIWPFTEGKTAEILLLVSYVGLFLNLFNLIPISPLDGGRVTQVVGPWFKYVGLSILLLYLFIVRQPALLLIVILVLDSFDRMTPWWLRIVLAAMLLFGMGGLMFVGFSPQPFWLDIFDCVVGSLFVLVFYWKDKDRFNTIKAGLRDKSVDDREYPARSVRLKWLLYYIGLTVFVVGVFLHQVQYMPHAVKTDAGLNDLSAEQSQQISP